MWPRSPARQPQDREGEKEEEGISCAPDRRFSSRGYVGMAAPSRQAAWWGIRFSSQPAQASM